jgi:hypothetical protein
MTDTDYTATRYSRGHQYNKPSDIEDLPLAERLGPVALVVHLENCPTSTLAAVGAALQAMVESSNVHLQRDGSSMTFRRELTGAERIARIDAARARYDLGADAYDKARAGAQLETCEQALLEQYVQAADLEMPTAKADA